MYEKDDGEYPAYGEELVQPRRKAKIIIGVALLTFAVIGTVLAQTINLSPNDRVEFGQGIVTVKACDTYIFISLNPSTATFSGNRSDGSPYVNESRVRSIQFSGLDTKACAGRKVKVQLFPTDSTTVLALYTDSGAITVDKATLVIDPDKAMSRADAITLLNGAGQNISYSDSYQSLDYNPETAVYTLAFSETLALMSDVTRINVETLLS